MACNHPPGDHTREFISCSILAGVFLTSYCSTCLKALYSFEEYVSGVEDDDNDIGVVTMGKDKGKYISKAEADLLYNIFIDGLIEARVNLKMCMGHHFGWGGGIAGFYTEHATTLIGGDQAEIRRNLDSQRAHMHKSLFKSCGIYVNYATDDVKLTEVTMVGVRLRNMEGTYVPLKALYEAVSTMRAAFETYLDEASCDTGVPLECNGHGPSLEDAVNSHPDLEHSE
jgi:hypothetical protein